MGKEVEAKREWVWRLVCIVECNQWMSRESSLGPTIAACDRLHSAWQQHQVGIIINIHHHHKTVSVTNPLPCCVDQLIAREVI